jgi:acyl dehydratase
MSNTTPELGSHDMVSPRLPSSLYFEDVVIGQRFRTREHKISDADIQGFCDLTFDHHPLHESDEFAQSMGFPHRIAHGLYSLALMEGIKTELGLYDTTSVASLGWDDVRFRKAVVSGDAVHVRVTFIGARLSSKGHQGIVTEQIDLCTPDGTVMVSATHAAMVICRPVH